MISELVLCSVQIGNCPHQILRDDSQTKFLKDIMHFGISVLKSWKFVFMADLLFYLFSLVSCYGYIV